MALVDDETLDTEGNEGTEDTGAEEATETPSEVAEESAASEEASTAPKPSLDDFLNDPAAKEAIDKMVQERSDRIFEKARRKALAEQRKNQRLTAAQRQAQEEAELEESGDDEALGKLARAKKARAAEIATVVQDIADTIEDALRGRQEFSDIGDEGIDDVAAGVLSRGGDIIDFAVALAEKKAEVAVAKLTAEFDKKLESEVNAKLREHGVEIRTKTEGAAPEISRATGSGRQMSYKDASLAYGEGRMSLEEFMPHHEAHEKERARTGY